MRSNSLLSERNVSIFKDFEELFNQGKRFDFIYEELSGKYFLVPKTIAKIVYSEAKKQKNENVNSALSN